ncbi:MAG: killer suppression protein [Elusimicrobiota bacterium]|nr:killer suppression protein [Elusimicrobiota bacterium]
MGIIFKSRKLETLCNSYAAMQREYGARLAKVLRRRLDDLRAVPNLQIMRNLPGRCHELTGARSGQLAVDLEHPKRLVFAPANETLPVKNNGGLDWAGVTVIEIIEIVDYH